MALRPLFLGSFFCLFVCFFFEKTHKGFIGAVLRGLVFFFCEASCCERSPRSAWSDQRCSESFGVDASCSLCGDPAGILMHQTYDCLAGLVSRQAVSLTRVDGPRASLNMALSWPPRPWLDQRPQIIILMFLWGPRFGRTGRGKFSSDPAFRSCTFSLATDMAGRAWALAGSTSQSTGQSFLLLLLPWCVVGGPAASSLLVKAWLKVIDALWARKRQPRGKHIDLGRRILKAGGKWNPSVDQKPHL